MTSTEEQSGLQSAGAESSGRIVGPIYYHKKFKQRVGQPAWALDEVTAPSSGDQSVAVEPAPSPSTERRPSAGEEDGHEQGAPGGSTAAGPPSLSPCSVGDEACVATVRRSTAAAGRYQCSFCGNFFAKPSVLDKHIRSHTNERPFSCSVCNYSFKTKSNFVKHCKTRKHTARCAGADVDSDEDDDEEPLPSDSDLSDQAEDMDVSWMLARDRPPRTGRALSHSIESIMGRQPPRTRSTSPIVKGVVSHIDKVIELNEAQLSGTRRALDSFGRHSSTLGREREAVRRGSLSSSNSTLDSSEGLTADLCPPPALIRSQSLCASSSGDMTHVLKRHLLSGVNHELAEASSVSKRRRLSVQESALAVHDAALSIGAPEEHRGRICNSLTGGQMHVYGEAERRASRETPQRAVAGSISMFVDSRTAHHSYPPSPHIMTIKSNLNSGGKMIEVAGSDATASGSSISQVGEPRTAASAPPLRHNPFRFPLSSSIVGDSFYPTIRAPNITPQLGPIRLPSRDMSSVCPVRQIRSPAVAKLPHNSTLTSLSKSPLFSPSGSVVSGASTNVPIQHRDNGAAKRKKLTIQIPPPGMVRQEVASPANWHHPSPLLSTPPHLVAFRHAVGHHRPSLVRQSPLDMDLYSQSTKLLSRTNSCSSWPSEPSGTGSSDSLNSSRHPLAIRIQTSHATAKQKTRCSQSTGVEAGIVPSSKSSINSSQVSALIPYIPGIPGPCSQGSDTPPRPAVPLRSHPPPLLPLSVTKLNSNCSRPNSLALRPVQYSQDRCGAALYSPETPRPRKTVQQTCLDGQCYTHIRLKSSTRLYFCCMFQTQPNYVQQEGGHRQVSMYSQWRHARPPVDSAPPLSALQLQRPGPDSCSDWCPATGSPPVLMRAGPLSLTALVNAPCRLPRLYGGVPPFQDNTPAVGLTAMTSSVGSDHASLDIASNAGCNSAILQQPGAYTAAISDSIRLSGVDESAAVGLRRDVSTAILHTEINSGKLAASGTIDSDGASSSSNSTGCEDDDRPIDLTVRADPTAAVVQQPSAVLSLMNCTEQLTCMYSNLQRISQLVAPSAATAPPPTAASSRADKPPPLTPISLSLSSTAVRGGSPVVSAVSSSAPSGGQRLIQVQSPRSVASLSATSSPSGEGAAATPAPAAGPSASCPPSPPTAGPSVSCSLPPPAAAPSVRCLPPAPTAVVAPSSCPAPPENNMQAVLNDIFNQVRTERASAGMATAGKSGADGPPVADSTAPSTSLSVPSPAAGQQLMHPNVTAGQPGLALTRPGPRSTDAEPLQHTDSSFFYRNSDRLVCSVCNKQDFVNRNQLSAHQKTHQMDQRRFRCSVCEIGFRSEQQLAKHRRTNEHMQKSMMLEKFGGKAQTDRRIYECLFCQRGFHNVGTLHKHFRCKTHVMGLENAGWLPCGVYAELESSGISARTDGPDSINVDCTWQNYCHLQELSLMLLHDRPAEMSDWRVKFEQIRRGSPPKHYPFEIDSKLRGNTDPSRPRPRFPDDFRGPQLKLEAADSGAKLSVQGCQSGLPVQ